MARQSLYPTDEQHLEGLKKEEEKAFEYLYRSYYRMVASYVTRNSGNDEDARDVFQEMLIGLVKTIRKPDFQLKKGTKLSTFIHAIAGKVWLMRLRKSKVLSSGEAELFYNKNSMEEEAIEQKMVYEKKHFLMSQVFEEISVDCRKLLDAYYFRKIPLVVVAKELGYTESFVRVKKNRCMSEFRNKILVSPGYKELKGIME